MDDKVRTLKSNWLNYLWQPALAVVFLTVVLFFMNRYTMSDVLWAVGAGSLASSCFIVFGNPSSSSSLPLKIIGGYVIGIVSGVIFRLIAMHIHDLPHGFLGTPYFHFAGVLAAFCAGTCLFFMSVLKLQHPPAAGMALVLVVDMRDYKVVFIVFIAALILASLRRLLCHHLKDLA